ncbi:hypothetical protein B7463_g11483, partial [Scytalidium lignicola]
MRTPIPDNEIGRGRMICKRNHLIPDLNNCTSCMLINFNDTILAVQGNPERKGIYHDPFSDEFLLPDKCLLGAEDGPDQEVFTLPYKGAENITAQPNSPCTPSLLFNSPGEFLKALRTEQQSISLSRSRLPPNSDDEDYPERLALSLPNIKLQHSKHKGTRRKIPKAISQQRGRVRKHPPKRRQIKGRARYSGTCKHRRRSPSSSSEEDKSADDESRGRMCDNPEREAMNIDLLESPSAPRNPRDYVLSDGCTDSDAKDSDYRPETPDSENSALSVSVPVKRKRCRDQPPQKRKHVKVAKDYDADYTDQSSDSSSDE